MLKLYNSFENIHSIVAFPMMFQIHCFLLDLCESKMHPIAKESIRFFKRSWRARALLNIGLFWFHFHKTFSLSIFSAIWSFFPFCVLLLALLSFFLFVESFSFTEYWGTLGDLRGPRETSGDLRQMYLME